MIGTMAPLTPLWLCPWTITKEMACDAQPASGMRVGKILPGGGGLKAKSLEEFSQREKFSIFFHLGCPGWDWGSSSMEVLIRMKDYKSLHAAGMICDTLVNTHTHTQLLNGYTLPALPAELTTQINDLRVLPRTLSNLIQCQVKPSTLITKLLL